MLFRASTSRKLITLVASVALAALTTLTGCAGRVDETVMAGELGTAIDEYFTAITPYGFSGALLVAKDGEVVLKKGYGLANDEEGIPNTPATVFSTGSITKQFTAAAVLALEMDGLLSTDDLLADHIDEVPEDKRGVTLHHLLTHTSGVLGSTGGDFEDVGRDEVVARALAAPLAFEPGSQMSYSNAGYSLLAAVVEMASGRPYEEYLREALFEPAGMKHTGYRLPDWDEGAVARWYDGDTDNGTPLERAYPHWNLLGNGGILSTPGDMFLWYKALKGDAVLCKEAKAKLWTPYLNDYAYGWDVIETDSGMLIEHDGASSLGASAEFRWFVDEDLVTMIFCNRSFNGVPLFEVVRSELRELTLGGEVDAPPARVDVAPEALAELAGKYRLSSGGLVKIVQEAGSLRLITFEQDVINALFQPDADPHTYKDLNARSGRLIAAAVSGNSEMFKDELGDGEFSRRVHEALAAHLRRFAERTHSALRASIALGTVRIEGDGTVMTGLRIKNADGGADHVSILWRDGQLVGIDQQAFLISIPMVPVSETHFIGYHLGFARLHPLSFNLDGDGSVVSLQIGPHVASRLGEPGRRHDHGDEGVRDDNGSENEDA